KRGRQAAARAAFAGGRQLAITNGQRVRADQDSPTISPFSSRSIRAAAGLVPSPGMVRVSPQIGYTNPAPTEARTSRTGSVQPVGAPLSAGSDEMDRCVLAMHTGSVPNPAFS